MPSINPAYTGYRRDKHSSYETFAAQEDLVTVSLFAPEPVRAQANSRQLMRRLKGRPVPGPTRAAAALIGTRGGDKKKKHGAPENLGEEEAAAFAAGEAAVEAAASVGQIIVTAGYSGDIRIFENSGLPAWI